MKRLLKPLGLAVAILALLASVVAGREKPSVVVAEQVAATTIDLSRIERTPASAGAAPATDPFAPKDFNPPAREPQQAAAAKPEAPALPFRYLGKLIEDGKLSVFLANGAESVTAVAGQRLGDYRVDKVTESEVQFTYLPLKTKQSLPL
jgi:hypothetical protein